MRRYEGRGKRDGTVLAVQLVESECDRGCNRSRSHMMAVPSPCGDEIKCPSCELCLLRQHVSTRLNLTDGQVREGNTVSPEYILSDSPLALVRSKVVCRDSVCRGWGLVLIYIILHYTVQITETLINTATVLRPSAPGVATQQRASGKSASTFSHALTDQSFDICFSLACKPTTVDRARHLKSLGGILGPCLACLSRSQTAQTRYLNA